MSDSPGEREKMVHDIIFMRGNMYSKHNIVAGLAVRYCPRVTHLVNQIFSMSRETPDDPEKIESCKFLIAQRLALEYHPELLELVEKTLEDFNKDPLENGTEESTENNGKNTEKVRIHFSEWTGG